MIYEVKGKKPIIGKNYFIAPTASIIGDVVIGDNCSIWFSAVIRGDENSIRIGNTTNIQDNVTVHVGVDDSTIIGDNVTIGHNAIIHGCEIGSNVMIGMGSIILNSVKIPNNVMIGAGALVTPKLKIEEGNLVVGNPARVIRKLSDKNREYLKHGAELYKEDIKIYNETFKGEVKWEVKYI